MSERESFSSKKSLSDDGSLDPSGAAESEHEKRAGGSRYSMRLGEEVGTHKQELPANKAMDKEAVRRNDADYHDACAIVEKYLKNLKAQRQMRKKNRKKRARKNAN